MNNKMPQKIKRQLSIRLDIATIDALKAAASHHERSIVGEIQYILREALSEMQESKLDRPRSPF